MGLARRGGGAGDHDGKIKGAPSDRAHVFGRLG